MGDLSQVSCLERARSLHEDIERHETAVVALLNMDVSRHRDRIGRDHVVCTLLKRIKNDFMELATLYGEETLDERRDELEEIDGGAQGTTAAALESFSRRLDERKEHHKKISLRAIESAEDSQGMSPADSAARLLAALEKASYPLPPSPTQEELDVKAMGKLIKFTGPERGGRCLDLAPLFAEYQNIDPSLNSARFSAYLSGLLSLSEEDKDDCDFRMELLAVLPIIVSYPKPGSFLENDKEKELHERDTKALKYLKNLKAYLISFMSRAMPLALLDDKISLEAAQEWEDDVKGECRIVLEQTEIEIDDGEEHRDPDEMNDDNDNEDNNEEKKDSYHCELCNKDFANPSVFIYHQQGKVHKKRVERLRTQQDNWRESVWIPMAEQVHAICVHLRTLRDVLKATAEYDSARQARNAEEIDAAAADAYRKLIGRRSMRTDGDGDMDDGNEGNEGNDDGYYDSDEDTDDEEAATGRAVSMAAAALEAERKESAEEGSAIRGTGNIANYPVDAAGQPIPYWIYKLEGLGTEYPCEICGGATYRGRRAFEEHFNNAQHAAALKNLGINYSVEYFEITTVRDALMIKAKLEQDALQKGVRTAQNIGTIPVDADDEEEFEDADGNVYKKKMYLALIRQGIIRK